MGAQMPICNFLNPRRSSPSVHDDPDKRHSSLKEHWWSIVSIQLFQRSLTRITELHIAHLDLHKRGRPLVSTLLCPFLQESFLRQKGFHHPQRKSWETLK